MVQTLERELSGLLRRAPLGAAIGTLFLIAFTVFEPPSNLIYVFSGVPIGVGMCAALLFGFPYAARWAWVFAGMFMLASELLAMTALPFDGGHEFTQQMLFSLATLFGLLGVFRNQIEHRLDIHRAV